MKYFILTSLCLALNAQAQSTMGAGVQPAGTGATGYSSNTGFSAPGSFSSPTGAPMGPTNVVPNQTTMNNSAATPGGTINATPPSGSGVQPGGVSLDQMNTAPTPTPATDQSNSTFGTTLQTRPADVNTRPSPAGRDLIERQAQEDSMNYSTTPQTTNPRPSNTPGRAP